ncbi:hypothetical protein [Fimbriiglobus ruber]|uniref:Uncharacterized protein n=1 Tax=Fimbriiglobus ruber TaxID=1908690 RepID=A0A225DU19_9BACT|nr:hypothetical protein [Fimbriiglobus ruber]OWK42038.1 hypothetical protein FRUB_04116 [Fimbriiglobus ruber]
MQVSRKSLKELKNEAKERGYGVRKWAELAGLPWQIVYRRIGNEEALRISEYERLVSAIEKMKGMGDESHRQEA